jgi:hypothetical protein
MDKKLDEIEIEEISLDVDDKYEVTLDVNSSTEDLLSGLTIDESKEEIGGEIKEGSDLNESSSNESSSEELGKEELGVSELPQEAGEVEENQEENNISLSVDELDSILSDAKVEEVIAESTEIGTPPIGTGEPEVAEGEEEHLKSVDFSSAEEAVSLEEEKLSEGEEETVKDYGDIVFMSSESYNKVTSEEISEESLTVGEETQVSEELPPIEEKPQEEAFTVSEEEISAGTVISPEDLGISGEGGKETGEFEVGEFPEITEEMIESQKLDVLGGEKEEEISFSGVGEESPFEVSETKGGEIVGGFEEIEEIGLGEIKTGEESQFGEIKEEVAETGKGKEFEIVDDISVSKREFEGISESEEIETIGGEEEIKVSVTPEEVGLEEIELTPQEETEEIVGIGFEGVGEEKIEKPLEGEVSGAEEVVNFVEESVGLAGIGEVPQEVITQKSSKIEEAIEGLTESEKEGLRKVLGYLDKLLENLPEEKVKEFASSEYYDLYVRLFDKLNIK